MDTVKSKAALDQVLRRRVLAWGVRWTIAFAVIWWLTARSPDMAWLWPLAIVIAMLSFGVILFMAGRMKAKLAEGAAHQATLDQIRAESEAEDEADNK